MVGDQNQKLELVLVAGLCYRASGAHLDGRLHGLALVAGDGPVDDIFVQVIQPQLLRRGRGN